jgi:hypothetical protein
MSKEYILVDLGVDCDGKKLELFSWSGRSFKLELIQDHKYFFTRRQEGKYVILSKHPEFGFITNKRDEEDEDYGHQISVFTPEDGPDKRVLINDAAFSSYIMALLDPDA